MQQRPASTECPLQRQEQANSGVPQPHGHAGDVTAAADNGQPAAAAQVGGRLQRLRLPELPEYTGNRLQVKWHQQREPQAASAKAAYASLALQLPPNPVTDSH